MSNDLIIALSLYALTVWGCSVRLALEARKVGVKSNGGRLRTMAGFALLPVVLPLALAGIALVGVPEWIKISKPDDDTESS